MTVISENPRLVDLGGGMYLVKDKFMYFPKGGVDIGDPEWQQSLLGRSDTLYDTRYGFDRLFGRQTVSVFDPRKQGGFINSQLHMDSLPDAVRHSVRGAQDVFGL